MNRKLPSEILHHKTAGKWPSQTAKAQLQWDLITAMRGPDDTDPVVKHIFTERLRYLLFRDACPVAVRREAVVSRELLTHLETVPYNPHFASHVLAAIQALYSLGCIREAEREFLDHLISLWSGYITLESVLQRYEEFIR